MFVGFQTSPRSVPKYGRRSQTADLLLHQKCANHRRHTSVCSAGAAHGGSLARPQLGSGRGMRIYLRHEGAKVASLVFQPDHFCSLCSMVRSYPSADFDPVTDVKQVEGWWHRCTSCGGWRVVRSEELHAALDVGGCQFVCRDLPGGALSACALPFSKMEARFSKKRVSSQ